MPSRIYNPIFRWEDDTIYDRGEPIARFSHHPGASKPILLDEVKLRPGGEPLITWNLTWRSGFYGGTNQIEDLQVHTPRPDELQLAFTGTMRNKTYRTQTEIVLCYDSKRNCYRYDTNSTLFMDKFPFWSWKEIDGDGSAPAHVPYEYANVKPIQGWNFYYPFHGKPKKWQAYVYRGTEGNWVYVPQHHLHTPDKENIHFSTRFANSPTMGFIDEPSGNPCVELKGQTLRDTLVGLCWALHDIHLTLPPNSLVTRFDVQYAIYLFTAEENAEIIREARPRQYTELEKQIYDRPRFDPGEICGFEKGYDLHKGDVNSHFWLPQGDIRYTEWNSGEGRNGGKCLKTETPMDAVVAWQLESTNSLPVEGGKRYVVSAFVKTDALEGEAFLELSTPDNTETVSCSEKISGTTPWYKLEALVEAAQSDPRINMRLVHKGKGTSWFDDIEVGPAD